MKTDKRMKSTLIMLSILILISISLNSACAATANNNSTIYVSTHGNNTYDGLSAEYNSTTGSGPKATITNATGTVTSGGNVYIAKGTYNESGIIINKNMNIIGENQQNSMINGQKSGNRIFLIASGIEVTITNLTLTNGTSMEYGGAIINYGSLTVENSTFTGNTAFNGGAIWNGGILSIGSSKFTSNTATASGTGTGGGAIYNAGAILNINNSEFTGNAATGNAGGAIYSYSGTTITVSNSKFTQNTSKTGGGAIRNNGSGTTLTVSNSKFTQNHAEYGGAICNSGTANIINSNFTDNNVTNAGGAICNDQGTLNANNSTFTKNTAQEKGGVLYNYSTANSNGTITVANSTFTCNSAPNGGILHNSGGNATISFNRIKDNGSSEIYNDHGMVDARYNWWGSNDNPSNHVNNDVNVSTWLVLTVTVDNSSILIDGNSTVTADLQHDSNGKYHDPVNGHVPDGTLVTFKRSNTSLGSLSTISTTLTNGTATTMFTAANSGNENVTATIDNQLESTLITINKSNNNNNTTNGNNTNTVNAATQTIAMQHTGAPLAGLALAILAIFSGLLPRSKQ